ncbi:MAG TPA: cadmium-translocating P-type ATPase, partial [Anaerolineae bacterium]|nr:cadmium-translocating P-type ATPase [Anaerolineae bacterium]
MMDERVQRKGEARSFLLRVEGMDCADCALHLEEATARLEGVGRVEVSFTTGRMRLVSPKGEEVLPQVQKLARQMGYEVLPAAPPGEVERGLRGLLRRHRRVWPTGAAGLLLLVALVAWLLERAAPLVDGLLIAAALMAGLPLARRAGATLRAARTVDMNGLMTIAAVGALAIGEYAEAAVAVFLFAVGEALEAYTMDRARGAIRALMDLRPAEAIRLTADGEERVPVESLAVGDRVLVRPGERIPADGRVGEGRSAVDQATVTGESLPVGKGPGDEVFAGTINGAGALVVEVTRIAADSTLARVIRMVEEAQEQRAPSQRFVDRFARVYTPAVVAGAVLVAVLPPLVGGGAPLDWLYRALALLVIACPCALVISTPVAVVSGLTAAARAGVLIKGGVHLEQLARVRAIAFDKTGTLTRGKPRLVGGRCAGHDPRRAPQECEDCLDLLAKAAAVERRSEHPLARAVVEAAFQLGVEGRYRPAEGVEAVAGRGVRGR